MGAKQDPAEDYVTILFKPVAFLQFGSAAARIGEVRMIKDVERFRAELQGRNDSTSCRSASRERDL
jgi:hypothetical protein